MVDYINKSIEKPRKACVEKLPKNQISEMFLPNVWCDRWNTKLYFERMYLYENSI